MSDGSIGDRKVEHLDIIRRDEGVDRRRHYFDEVRLIHRALPELDLAAVDPSIEFLGRHLAFPLLISSMTGGDHDVIRTVNRNLAEAAQAAGVALGVGSMRVMFGQPEARLSFELRRWAPDVPLLANLGAVQLNHGYGIEQAREAVETLDADALILHFNPLQEAVQPEGDTEFAGLADRVAELVDALPVPVVAKEVGAGLSRPDAELLLDAGVRVLDVAGSGGTSWSRIEHHRSGAGDDLGIVFQDWGNPTPAALRDLAPLRVGRGATLVASGGVRDGVDMVKAMVLGASVSGLARPLLEPATKSAGDVLALLEARRREFVTAQFLLGVARAEDLVDRPDLVRSFVLG